MKKKGGKQLLLCLLLVGCSILHAQNATAFPTIFEGLAKENTPVKTRLLEERILHWIDNLSDRPALLALNSKSLFYALEENGYFKAASFLSEQLIDQERCNFDRHLQRKIDHYTAVKEGEPIPDFSLQDPNALKIHFADKKFEKRKTVLFFWSSGCSHCQRELPQVAALQEELNQQNIALLSISLDREEAVFRSTAQRYDWAHYCDFKSWNSPVVQSFKVFATPSFFLVEKGILHKEFLSAAQLAAYLNP